MAEMNAELKKQIEELEAKAAAAEAKAKEAEAKANKAEAKAAESEAKAKEAEAKAAEAEAEQTVQAQTEPVKAERVELFIPRGNASDEPNLFISVNGKSYLLPKGKKSMVPVEVKAEYERALRAQERYDATVEELLAKAKEPK